MIVPLFVLAAQSASSDNGEIVITASRVPEEQSATAASTSVIDAKAIERLGEPLAPALIRLTPSAAVETGGPAGSLSQVRIRGAEANHTLLFIDGIRANDPAAGDIPRFELLNADIVSRIEVVRGPQSALWGSDAIGGVVAINGVPVQDRGLRLAAESGSFGFERASASGVLVSDSANLAAALAWQRSAGIDSFSGTGERSAGIDSFSGTGERDGYRNLAGRLRASWSLAPGLAVGAAGFALNGRSEFDGFDPATFLRSDTLDSTTNRLSAGRFWLSAGDGDHGLSGTIATALLRSSNRNFLDGEEINRTRGERWTTAGQLQYRFATGKIRHSGILAVDHSREEFSARDTLYFGASNQDRRRSHNALTAEWRAEIAPVIADLAVRHDRFSAFKDATTLRLSGLVALGRGVSAAASYSEGIAQPSFFDLHGFFPGSFVGNPALKPESSRGFEVSLRYRSGALAAEVSGYRQRLHDEIVDVFDPATFVSSTVNRATPSHRSGAEVQLSWSAGDRLRLAANYAYLDASEPGAVADARFREVRRPKHSGAVTVDGEMRGMTYGASLAYVGARADTDFGVFPAQRVRLKPYWLATARVAHRIRPGLEIFARASNLLDARYQDVFGYRTEGRALYAGFRLGAR